jgi:hypothetical protein
VEDLPLDEVIAKLFAHVSDPRLSVSGPAS